MEDEQKERGVDDDQKEGGREGRKMSLVRALLLTVWRWHSAGSRTLPMNFSGPILSIQIAASVVPPTSV